MVRPRRLRHKLMLGLALVVGSVGLLLGGTLYGFRAYTNTVRTTERKLYEHQQVEILLVALTEPPRSSQTDVNTEFSDLNKMTNLSRDIAAAYRVELSRTVEQGLDPDDGYQEGKLLDQFDDALNRLSVALQKARNKPDAPALHDDLDVKAAYDSVQQIGRELRHTVVEDIDTSIRRANASIRQSLWIIGGAVVELLVIVLALLLAQAGHPGHPLRDEPAAGEGRGQRVAVLEILGHVLGAAGHDGVGATAAGGAPRRYPGLDRAVPQVSRRYRESPDQ